MLVITRRVGESLRIGSNIVVKVIEVSGYRGKARLGVQAPLEVEVKRKEQNVVPPPGSLTDP